MLGDSFEDIEFSPYKYLNHIDKIRNLAHDKDVFPVTVELDLVDFCNHNCWWCVDPAHSNNSLERSFVSKLLIELKSLGVKGVVFKGGGEPTLHQQFADILNEAKELGFEIGIVTNGSQLAKLHKSIVSAASYVRVSIDGPTSESHNKLHRSNDFSKIMDGVSQIMILRKKNKQRHPIVGLSFAMDYAMIHLVKEAIALGDISGVDYVFFRPPFFEEAGRKSSMTVEQKKKLITEFERQKQAYTGEMRILIDYWISDFDAKKISSREESPRRGGYMRQGANGIEHITGRCLATPLFTVITADKKVYPCCNLRFVSEWNIGTLDYANGQTFKQIWESKKRTDVLKRIKKIECIKWCTHPMSRYNEIIEYFKSPKYHNSFV